MNDLLLFGLLIILLLLVQFTPSKSADEIIEKHLKARGGRYKLSNLESIAMQGVRLMNETESLITIHKVRNKICHTAVEYNGMVYSTLITHQEAWTRISPGKMRPVKILHTGLNVVQAEPDIAGPLFNYFANGHKAALLGKELLQDNQCYKIKLTTDNQTELFYWVDSSNYLLIQSALRARDVDNNSISEQITRFGNYQMVDGILFAHLYEVTNTMPGSETIPESISFTKILVNPGIDIEKFQPYYQPSSED